VNNVHVQSSDQVKYLGVLLNVSLKDDMMMISQKQVKSLYLCSKQLRGILAQCSPAV